MKMRIRNTVTQKGFTLLEVIVTLTVAAILASLLVAFMGTSIIKSSDPIKQIRDLSAANGRIETVSAVYACYLSGCTDNSVCCAGCKCTWNLFKTACGSYGTCSTVDSGGVFSSSFETIQVTVNNGNQKMVSYFMK